MVAGAALELAEKGLDGTSFASVLDRTAAPRGSTYHHFPGGKRELVQAAIDLAGEHARAVLEPVRGQPAPEVVRRFFGFWRQLLVATDLRAGCAVLAVTVDAADAEMRAHAGRIFRHWREHLASLLISGGLEVPDARAFAATCIAAAEGAVALARAEQDWEPFDLVEAALIAQAVSALRRDALGGPTDAQSVPLAHDRHRRAPD